MRTSRDHLNLHGEHFLDSVRNVNEDVTPPKRLSRAEARERTRQRLLAAAAAVVARRGFAGASVSEIAETAGHTDGALYAHFASKDELIVEAMHTHVAERVAEARSMMDAGSIHDEGSRRELGKMLAALADVDTGSTPLFWTELWLHAARNPELASLLAAHSRTVDEVIADGIRSRTGARPEPGQPGPDIAAPMSEQELAVVVSSLVRGLAQRRRIDPAAVPERLLGQALQLLMVGRRTLHSEPDQGESS